MGLLKSAEKLFQSAIGVALVPVDLVREIIPEKDNKVLSGKHLKPRLKKLRENFVEAIDGIDESVSTEKKTSNEEISVEPTKTTQPKHLRK